MLLNTIQPHLLAEKLLKMKISAPTNDLRPVALTSAVMKVFERVVLIRYQVLVTDFPDPWQFAYSIYAHLDKPGTYIRLMFFDFSSAFNTIQPHLLAEKLLKMKISAPTIL